MSELQKSLFGEDVISKAKEQSLQSIVKEWSHDGAGKLRPLPMLLFEAPVLLPPYNPLVEQHEYFGKWKVIHRNDIEDCGDDDQAVSKLARKCKLFLHPDKWPQDLNEGQKLLLQSIWDVFQESALF